MRLATMASGASLSALIWAAASTGAWAQAQAPEAAATAPTADTAGLEQIVVTARRSAERLQDVPLAISAQTSVQLQERGITDLQALARYTPSLVFKDYLTTFHGNPTIRGQAQINITNPITNVGVFVDGVYLQRDYQVNQSLGDFDRIEVVKGPQSALYGANTFSGAINYVTKTPTDDFHGNGLATVGDAGQRRFEAGVGGPIVKGILDGRIYVGADDYRGTIRNNAPGMTGDDKYFNGHKKDAYSAALRFTPANDLTFDLYYGHNHTDQGIRAFYTLTGTFSEDKLNCGPKNAFGNGVLFCGTFPTDPAAFRSGVGNPPKGLFSGRQPRALQDNDLLRFGADWTINSALSAHYVFGMTRGQASEDFSYFSNTYNPSAAGGATTLSQQVEGGKIKYSSHEARLDYDAGQGVKLEVGYFHSDATDRYALKSNPVPITGSALPPLVRWSDDPLYAPPSAVISIYNLAETFKVDALFGRASYSFLDDRATLSAELRYTITKLDYTDVAWLATHPGTPDLHATYHDPVPRFTAEYKLTNRNLLYASAAEGIKTGGFNGYGATSNGVSFLYVPQEQSFGEEKNWTYELGSKNTLFDGALVLNADVFYIDWKDKQSAVVATGAPACTTVGCVVANIYQNTANATNYGVEVEGTYQPIRPLRINFSATLMNPKYGDGSVAPQFVGLCAPTTAAQAASFYATACAGNGNIAGKRLERESPLSGMLGLEWRDHLWNDWDYFGGVDGTWQSMQYTDQENLGKIKGYGLVDARLGVQNDRWRAFLFVRNLGDKLYVDSAFYTQSTRQYTPSFGERRTFGLTVTGNF